MPHVVTEACLGCKNTVCVSVCPVFAFREDQRMLVIDPDECIDCGACVPECPTHAIFALPKVPPKWKHYAQINAERSKILPMITKQKTPLHATR